MKKQKMTISTMINTYPAGFIAELATITPGTVDNLKNGCCRTSKTVMGLLQDAADRLDGFDPYQYVSDLVVFQGVLQTSIQLKSSMNSIKKWKRGAAKMTSAKMMTVFIEWRK